LISVLSYGATGNGVTDDTVAINNAIAAIGATGGHLYFPPGTYKISNTLNVNFANVTLIGEGIGATRILSTNTSADIVKFYSATQFTGGGIRDMSLEVSGTASAGAAVRINGQNSITLERLWIFNPYSGIVLEGDNRACRLRDIDVSDHLGDAFTIRGGGNQYLDTCTTYRHSHGGGVTAFLVTNTEGAWFNACVSQLASYGVRVVPGAGQQVIDLWFTACDFDASASDGVVFDSGTNGGRITTVIWNGSRVGFGDGRGLVIDGNETKDLQFSNLRSEKNLGHGVVIANGRDIHFSNAFLLGNASGGAANTYGAHIVGGTGIEFIGGKSGAYETSGNNQNSGIAFGATFSGVAVVSGMDLRGNVTAGAINGGTTPASFRDCPGFKTQAQGTVILPAGATSLSIPHGLAALPVSANISSPFGTTRMFGVDVNATNITVSVNAGIGVASFVRWWASAEV